MMIGEQDRVKYFTARERRNSQASALPRKTILRVRYLDFLGALHSKVKTLVRK